ncbi:MAG: hypothetical protein V8R14_00520 [Clostridia bacterium]
MTVSAPREACGPADAPALGISQKDTDALKKAIEKSGENEIEVVFNADSVVTENVESQNVWGEIPGKTDEVIYMMARIEQSHSFYDDASGCGLSPRNGSSRHRQRLQTNPV